MHEVIKKTKQNVFKEVATISALMAEQGEGMCSDGSGPLSTTL
jgi:hypothetical protein